MSPPRLAGPPAALISAVSVAAVRSRKCSHDLFKVICPQCQSLGVAGGGLYLCEHLRRRSYCKQYPPGVQRCTRHPESTKALCRKCVHRRGYGASLRKCDFMHAYTSKYTRARTLRVHSFKHASQICSPTHTHQCVQSLTLMFTRLMYIYITC